MTVQIGNKQLDKPIIQGGMEIGVSRSSLAGAVAKAGGMGVISTAQVGYDAPLFRADPEEANLQALPVEIQIAKRIAGNIMSVTQRYGDYVKAAAAAGADAIISGAGLPLNLPEFTKGSDSRLHPSFLLSGRQSRC